MVTLYFWENGSIFVICLRIFADLAHLSQDFGTNKASTVESYSQMYENNDYGPFQQYGYSDKVPKISRALEN